MSLAMAKLRAALAGAGSDFWLRDARAPASVLAGAAALPLDRDVNWSEADMRARAEFALRAAYAHGTVAVRTHLDSYMPHAPKAWRMFRQLRDDWAGRITLQASSIAPLDRFAGEEGAQLADIVAESGGVLGMVTRLSRWIASRGKKARCWPILLPIQAAYWAW